MPLFYLVRHSQTAWLDEDRYQTRSDVPLSESGRTQARQLALRLASVPFDAAYASDLSRAAETARLLVEGRTIPILRRRELREVDVGEWEGLSGAEVDERYPGFRAQRDRDPLAVVPPGGEPMADALARIQRFHDELRERHAGGAVLVVAHQNSLRILLTFLLGLPQDYHRRFILDTASLTVVREQDSFATLVLLNDTSHLLEDDPP